MKILAPRNTKIADKSIYCCRPGEIFLPKVNQPTSPQQKLKFNFVMVHHQTAPVSPLTASA